VKNEDSEKTTPLGFVKENFFQILSLVVVVFNLWLANTLSPIASDVRLLDNRVSAIEKVEPVSTHTFRIEEKLDQYIFETR
jgi:hypothetical protein